LKNDYSKKLVTERNPRKEKKRGKKDKSVYQKRYDFVAISEEKTCTKSSDCFGWNIRGHYVVQTSKKTGRSQVKIFYKIRAPAGQSFKKKNLFVVGMGFPYGIWKERTEVMVV